MKTFRDNAGRDWEVAISVAAVKRVRGALGVDLPGLVADKLKGLGELLCDPVRLVDVLYVLCRAQAEARGVGDEAFGEAMAGDALDQAGTALVEELADFFPDPRTRAAIRKVLEKTRALAGRVMAETERTLERLDVETLARSLIASSGASRASSGSTPAP